MVSYQRCGFSYTATNDAGLVIRPSQAVNLGTEAFGSSGRNFGYLDNYRVRGLLVGGIRQQIHP
jgi:hypothetical protein